MPLKLMMIMVILVICIPIVSQAVDMNQKYMMDSAMSRQADIITDAVRNAHYSGTGTSSIIDVSIPAGCEIELG